MSFISPDTNELNVKVVFSGPDPAENVRRITDAHARIGAPANAKLRRVHGDGKVFAAGATVVFFDVPVPVPPFHGHPVRMHVYAMEGAPTEAHHRVALAGLDALVIFPGGPGARDPVATFEGLGAIIVSLRYPLPTAVVQANPGADTLGLLDDALREAFRIFETHLVQRGPA